MACLFNPHPLDYLLHSMKPISISAKPSSCIAFPHYHPYLLLTHFLFATLFIFNRLLYSHLVYCVLFVYGMKSTFLFFCILFYTYKDPMFIWSRYHTFILLVILEGMGWRFFKGTWLHCLAKLRELLVCP
jgi:hypothetical protein